MDVEFNWIGLHRATVMVLAEEEMVRGFARRVLAERQGTDLTAHDINVWVNLYGPGGAARRVMLIKSLMWDIVDFQQRMERDQRELGW